jgi:hypothetical protein
MEKRALIAITLSVGVLLAWQLWVGTSTPPPRPDAPEAPAPAATAPAPSPDAPPSKAGAAPRAVAVAAPVAEVVSPLYEASFAADGSVTAWTIEFRGAKRLVVEGALRPLTVAVQRPGQGLEIVQLRPDAARVEVSASQPVGRLTFTGTTLDGMRLRRTLEFRADSYRIGAVLEVESPGRTAGPVDIQMFWATPVAEPGPTPTDPWHVFGEGKDGRQLLGRILIDQARAKGFKVLLAMRGGEALAALKGILARRPDDREALLALISYSRAAGDFATALEYAQRLARVAPNDPSLAGLIDDLARRANAPRAP